MINIVLFGKPGAGKGTQAEFLRTKYNLLHISTGDVFRYNIKNSTKLGELAKFYMDKGDLVPDNLTISMLENEVDKSVDVKGYIFDGFPRTIDQAKALDKFLTKKNMHITITIALEANDEELITRLLNRGKIEGRLDDQDEEKIRNRFEEYNKKTSILKVFYENQKKFHSINGIGKVREVNKRLISLIDKSLLNDRG